MTMNAENQNSPLWRYIKKLTAIIIAIVLTMALILLIGFPIVVIYRILMDFYG